MAASLNIANFVRGKCKPLLLSVRLYPRRLQLRNESTNTETEYEEREIDMEEIKKKIAKIRDCSGLSKKEKLRHHGKVPERFYSEDYRGDKRTKLRKMYAEYGSASGINPSIMFPSRAELSDLCDRENNWTQTFHQMKSNIEEIKASEAQAARLRDENIDKAMSKMDGLVKQYMARQKKEAENVQKQDKTESLLEEFRETYGFSVDSKSIKFKTFRRLKSEEWKEVMLKKKKEEKKASSKSLKEMLEEKMKQESQ